MYRNTTALPGVSSGFGFSPSSFFGVMMSMYSRTLQRQNLAEMDEHLLADIGVSRTEAEIEARKPFWRA